MPIRFIVSRAGGGKTVHCLDAVRDRLRRSPTEGPRLVLLVPEQAALQTERALIETPDLAGFTRCDVLSFRRLAHRVLSEVAAEHEEVTALSRLMVLRYLLARHRRSLRVYHRVADRNGFVASLAEQFTELFAQGIEPEDLSRIDNLPDAERPERALVEKLHDLHLLYRDYLSYLADGKVDADQCVDLACRYLPEATWLQDAEVWADGFAIFSRQEERALLALARMASSVEITFLADPATSVLRAESGPPEAGQLFSTVEDTITNLARFFRENGLAIDKPIRLQPSPLPRFSQAPALARLERQLFATPPTAPKHRHDGIDAGSTVDSDRAVRIFEAANRRVEVDRCVAEIHHLVHRPNHPLRYRDIAVIVRRMEPYHDLLSAAFEAHEIPYFLDRRRPVAHHPLIEWVRGLCRMCVDNLDVDAVRAFLKTGLTGLTWDEADELENYVLAHGIRSRRVWLGEPWHFANRRASWTNKDETTDAQADKLPDRINRFRDRLTQPIRRVLELSARGARQTGLTWASSFFGCLENVRAAETLADWAQRAESLGRLDEAEEHRQVWRDLVKLLEELVHALGEESMTVRRFGEVLDSGLSQFTVGLAPPSLDQVLVGSIERSRHPDIRAVWILGFNEGEFPAISHDRGVLTEQENEALRRLHLPLGRGTAMRIDQERLLVYIALTRPRERLRISYAAADEQGKTLAPSAFLPYVLGAVDDLRVEPIAEPTESRATWNLGTSREVAVRLALEMSLRPPLAQDQRSLRARWNGLYGWARSTEDCSALLARAFASFSAAPETPLPTWGVQALYGPDRPFSVTQLESAAWCPFKHFAGHGLGLRSRTEHALEPADLGQLHHAILENLIRDLLAEGKQLAELSDAELVDRLTSIAERQSRRLEEQGLLNAARSRFKVGRAVRELHRAVAAQQRVISAGRFRPVATEVPFGFPNRPDSLPALDLDSPGGRHLMLRGFIDRVDVAEDAVGVLGMIVDYKGGRNHKLQLNRLWHGLQLQLLTYLLVVERYGDLLPDSPRIPAGSFFFNLHPGYELVKHPSEARDASMTIPEVYRPRGLYDATHATTLDANLQDGGRSRTFQMHITKGGRPGASAGSFGGDTKLLQSLLDYGRELLGRLADSILDGKIAVSPVRLENELACNRCPYACVCRFEPISGKARTLSRISSEQVRERLHSERPA